MSSNLGSGPPRPVPVPVSRRCARDLPVLPARGHRTRLAGRPEQVAVVITEDRPAPLHTYPLTGGQGTYLLTGGQGTLNVNSWVTSSDPFAMVGCASSP